MFRNVPADIFAPICDYLDSTSHAKLFATFDSRIQQLLLYPRVIKKFFIDEKAGWEHVYLGKHLNRVEELEIGHFRSLRIPAFLVPVVTRLDVSVLRLDSPFTPRDFNPYFWLAGGQVNITALFPSAIHVYYTCLLKGRDPIAVPELKSFLGSLSARLESLHLAFRWKSASNIWSFLAPTLRHLTLVTRSSANEPSDARLINVIAKHLPNLETLDACLCELLGGLTDVPASQYLPRGAKDSVAALPESLTSLSIYNRDYKVMPHKLPERLTRLSYGKGDNYSVNLSPMVSRTPHGMACFRDFWVSLPKTLRTLELASQLDRGSPSPPAFPSGLTALKCGRWLTGRDRFENLATEMPHLRTLQLTQKASLQLGGGGSVGMTLCKSLTSLVAPASILDLAHLPLLPPNLLELSACFVSLEVLTQARRKWPRARFSATEPLPWSGPLLAPEETVLDGFTLSRHVALVSDYVLDGSIISIVPPRTAQQLQLSPISFPDSLTRVSLTHGFTSTPAQRTANVLEMPFSKLKIHSCLLELLPDSVTEIDLGTVELEDIALTHLPASLLILRHQSSQDPISQRIPHQSRIYPVSFPKKLEVLDTPGWCMDGSNLKFPCALRFARISARLGIEDLHLYRALRRCAQTPEISLVGGAVMITGLLLRPEHVAETNHMDLEGILAYSQGRLEACTASLTVAEWRCNPSTLKSSAALLMPRSLDVVQWPKKDNERVNWRMNSLPIGPQVRRLECCIDTNTYHKVNWPSSARLKEMVLWVDTPAEFASRDFPTGIVPRTLASLTIKYRPTDASPKLRDSTICIPRLPPKLFKLVAPHHAINPISNGTWSSQQYFLKHLEISLAGEWTDVSLRELFKCLPKLKCFVAHSCTVSLTLEALPADAKRLTWDILLEQVSNNFTPKDVQVCWKVEPSKFLAHLPKLQELKEISLVPTPLVEQYIESCNSFKFNPAHLSKSIEFVDLHVTDKLDFTLFNNAFSPQSYSQLITISLKNCMELPSDFGANLPRSLECLSLPNASSNQPLTLRSIPPRLRMLLLKSIILAEQSALELPLTMTKLKMAAPWSSWVTHLIQRRMPSLIIVVP